MTGRVIVVGSVNIDLVVTGRTLPAPGETVIGGRFAQHHGGKGGNQAVAAARLGATTSFVGAVGDDDFGRSARAALEAERIDVSELRTLPDQATGVALILVDAHGENSISVASGANGAVTPEQVAASVAALAPGPGDVVLVGHEIPTAVVAEALRAAGERGATTILNPAPASGLDAETVALAELVTPNEGELATLHQAGVRAERAPGEPRVGGRGTSHAGRLGPDPGAARRGRRHGRGGRHVERRACGGAGHGPPARGRGPTGGSGCFTRCDEAWCARGHADTRRARGGPPPLDLESIAPMA